MQEVEYLKNQIYSSFPADIIQYSGIMQKILALGC